jgi:WD40 repeat protein
VLAGVPRLVGVCFHSTGVDDVDMDPAGTRLLTRTADRPGKRGHSAYVWDFAAGKLAAPPLAHAGPVRHAGFSPDGSRVLTASEDHTAALWDAATGKRLRVLTHDAPVVAAAFAPDGKAVATAAGKRVTLWDVATGDRAREPIECPADVYALEFSRAGGRLVTADRGGHARVWEAATGRPVGRPIPQVVPGADESRFYKMGPALSPDGRCVLAVTGLVGGEWATARAYEASTGKVLWKVAASGFFLGWSSDGRRAVVAIGNDQQLIDADSGKVLKVRHSRESAFAALTPDGRWLAAGISGGGIYLWDAATGKAISPPLQCADFLRRLRFSADGKRLMAASQDGTARVWDLSPLAGLAPRPYAGDCGRADVPVYPDGSSASPDGRTRFRPGPDGGTLERPVPAGPKPLPHPARVTASRFSPDGTRLATFAATDVRVWDATTGDPVSRPMPLGDGPVPTPQLQFGGRRVAAVFPGSANRAVLPGSANRPAAAVVWDAETGRRLFTLPARIDSGRTVFGPAQTEGEVQQVSLSPDGRLMAAGVESSGELSVFDVGTEVRLYCTKAFRGYLYALAFGPDGRTLWLAATDGVVRELDVATGRPVGPPLRHSLRAGAPGVTPDGRRVATVSADGRLRVWDGRTGDLLASFPAQADWRRDCWFSRDGMTVQYFSWVQYRRLPLPTYAGPPDAVPRAVRLLAGRYLDETDGLADLGPYEFLEDRQAYRQAWLAWQGLPDDPSAQP